jgi:5'-nucleotidase
MTYDISNKLTIGLASSALFDLTESDRVFREQGKEPYAKYQKDHERDVLNHGVAFPFIRRLLSLNEIRPNDPLIEVILLSRNDMNTGLRVMNSIEHYGLGITRVMFLQGAEPHPYIKPFDIELFLSANEQDVRSALENGLPAGQILDSHSADDENDHQLRLAFDFDGVLVDDESESVYQESKSLDNFHDHEVSKQSVAHNPGPLKPFIDRIHQIQKFEQTYAEAHPNYAPKLNIAIVTARSAPAHKRVINTMQSWNVHPDQAFFLGGIDKSIVLGQYKPHMFFDDQRAHLDRSASVAPAVHVPFGALNQSKVMKIGKRQRS